MTKPDDRSALRVRPGAEGGGFCCQVPPNPACRSLTRQDFKFGLSSRITRPEQPEHSCRWQLWIWPDNGGTMPGKSTSFTPSSILFRPRDRGSACADPREFGGAAGYCPRVRKVYYDARLSPYPALAGRQAQYRRAAVKKIGTGGFAYGRACPPKPAGRRWVSRETFPIFRILYPPRAPRTGTTRRATRPRTSDHARTRARTGDVPRARVRDGASA